MAASVACSHPHVFAHTLRFSARGFLALTKNAGFLEVPFNLSLGLMGEFGLIDMLHILLITCRFHRFRRHNR